MFPIRETNEPADGARYPRRGTPRPCRAVLAFAAWLILSASSLAVAQEPDLAPFSFCELCGLPPVERGANENFPGASLLPQTARALSLEEYAPEEVTFDEPPTVRGTDLSVLAVYPYRGRVFGYGLGSWGTQDAQGSSYDRRGFDVGSYGGALGQDWTLTEYFLWGYGVQTTQTNVDSKSASFYDASVDSLAGFLRMSVFGALWHIDLLYGGSRNWERQTRLSTGAQNKFNTTQWFFESEFGARYDKGYTRIEPRANFRVLSLVEPARAEEFLTGKSRPEEFSKSSYRMKLGSRFSWEYATALGVTKPYITCDWSHEFGNRAIYTINDQAPVPVAYRYGSHKMQRDKLMLGAGLDYALRDTFDVYFHYDAEIAAEYANHLFFAGFNKKF